MKTTFKSIKSSMIGMTLLALGASLALGQPVTPPPVATGQPLITSGPKGAPEQTLKRFDLDFAGGTPAELVAAIHKAQARPLNAIVPDEFASMKLPALKMKNVSVAMLFEALTAASRKAEAVTTGQYYGAALPGSSPGYASYTTATSAYGFRTQGVPTDDSIWYFYVEKPTLPPASPHRGSVCRFYSLAPYLENGFKVDDITTAIETGWKMLAESPAGSPRTGSAAPTASIRFHKDTKLLIAVGDPSHLETIDAVLSALSGPRTKMPPMRPTTPPPAVPAEKPAGQPKAEEQK